MTDTTFKKLTGITADDHNSIELEVLERPDRIPRLIIKVESSGTDRVFLFDNPHEARTFFTRALHQVGLYIEESTPAEDLQAEIFGFLKVPGEFGDVDHINTRDAVDLLRRAAHLLGG